MFLLHILTKFVFVIFDQIVLYKNMLIYSFDFIKQSVFIQDNRTCSCYKLNYILLQVFYYGDSLQLDLLDKARNQNSFIYIEGDIRFEVEDIEAIDPITFMTEEAVLRLPRWNAEVRSIPVSQFEHQGRGRYSCRTPMGCIFHTKKSLRQVPFSRQI